MDPILDLRDVSKVYRVGDLEVVALRDAQATLGTHDLRSAAGGPFSLYASAAPCIQCFGAVYWSGLSRVVAAAPKEDAEAFGFREGPVTPALWAGARNDKGIVYEERLLDPATRRAPFETYAKAGGPVY